MTSPRVREAIRRTVTALVLTTACIVATAGTAHADVSDVWDEFDNNPAARWTFWSSGVGAVVYGDSEVTIHHQIDEGWSEISRDVRVPFVGKHECFAGIALRGHDSGTSVTVNIEVINPATWTYVSMRQVQISGTEMKGYSTPHWKNGPANVKFRVSMLAAGGWRTIHADDMAFICIHES